MFTAARAGLVFGCFAVIVALGCTMVPGDPNGNANDNFNPTTFRLTSTAFAEGGAIPARHTDDGLNVSPPLAWENAPEDTVEFALLVDDPDSNDRDPFAHWIIYSIPATATGLPENVTKVAAPADPAGSLQGLNDFDMVGYDGPAPPEADEPHSYRFRLFALSAPSGLASGVGKGAFLNAVEGRTIAEARLTGTYDR